MENQLCLPQHVINNLKCYVCKNHLNVAPIMATSEDGNLHKCGRCKHVSTRLSLRNLLYENVAAFVSFPCINRHCKEPITYGKVEDHEKNCKHRTVVCPIYWESCTSDIKVTKVRSHFEQKHRSLLHFGEANFNYSFGYYCIHLLEKKQQQFLIYVYQDGTYIYIGVFSFQAPVDVKFEVTLSATQNCGNTPYITFVNKDIIPYNEREHCLKCVGRKCLLHYHKFHQNKQEFLQTLPVKIKKESIHHLAPSDQLNYIINIVNVKDAKGIWSKQLGEKDIVKKPDANSASPFSNVAKTSNIYSTLQDNLECPVCKEYMMPPIYTCIMGHTICKTCKPCLTNCPLCRKGIDSSRNFILEEISRVIEVSCRYVTEGCIFSGNIETIRQHEVRCLYKN